MWIELKKEAGRRADNSDVLTNPAVLTKHVDCLNSIVSVQYLQICLDRNFEPEIFRIRGVGLQRY